jgi:hypothetical protein
MRDVAQDIIDYLFELGIIFSWEYKIKYDMPRYLSDYGEFDKVSLQYDVIPPTTKICGTKHVEYIFIVNLSSWNTNCSITFDGDGNGISESTIRYFASGIACFIGKHKNEFVISKNLVDGFSNAVDLIAILNCIWISKDIDLLETIMHDAYELGHREVLYDLVEWFSDNDDPEFTAFALRVIHNLRVECNANFRL